MKSLGFDLLFVDDSIKEFILKNREALSRRGLKGVTMVVDAYVPEGCPIMLLSPKDAESFIELHRELEKDDEIT